VPYYWKITAEEEEEIACLYKSGCPIREIREKTGRSKAAIHSVLRRLGIPAINHLQGEQCSVKPPTPEEIEQRIQEVQAKWSKRVRESRRVTKKEHWTIPQCAIVLESKGRTVTI
jgi:IS30 family transposase